MDIKRPSYDQMNRLMNKATTTITAPFRFDDDLHTIAIHRNLQQMYTDLVPFPRIHFMTISIAPITGNHPRGNYFYGVSDVQSLSEYCFNSQLFFTKFSQICLYNFLQSLDT